MNATMRSCILEQPDTMQQVISRVPAEVANALDQVGRTFTNVTMVGSGTSLNAALAAKYLMDQWSDAFVQVVAPFDFNHYYPHDQISPHTLVIGISQTARSTGTINAVDLARTHGAKTIFVTAEPNKPGAQCAETILNTWTGPEPVGPKTKGFTSTMATLFYLAADLGNRALDLATIPEFLSSVIATSAEAMSSCVEAFVSAPSVTVISYGPNMGAAREGGLKVLETIRVPVEVYDVEEYMHGPYHCLEEDTFLVFIAPPGAGQERVSSLIRFVQEITPHTIVITDEQFAEDDLKNLVIALPGGIEEALTPLGYVIPLQLLANDITLAKGRRPEQSRHPDFHAMLGSKFVPQEIQ